MLVDLILSGRKALIVGEGKEPELKVPKLLDGGASVVVLGKVFTEGLRKAASKSKGRVELVQAEPTEEAVLGQVKEAKPAVVFVTTGDRELDEMLAGAVRSAAGSAALVCVIDEPRLNDFNMPAIAVAGDIRVGVSTGGKSPAMAALLRDKFSRTISRQDVLQVRLQGRMRAEARGRLHDPESRKEFAYRMLRDRRISSLLAKGRYGEARKIAEEMLQSAKEKEGTRE